MAVLVTALLTTSAGEGEDGVVPVERVESVVTETKILDDGWCPPAASVQSVRLLDTLGREVVEVVLHQLRHVITEEDLELRVKLVGVESGDLSE